MDPDASDRLDEPPNGWIALDGLLHADPTVAGYLARGQEVKGVCHQGDCRRRCELDLVRLARRGFGALEVTSAQGFLMCRNLTGCGLDFPRDRRAGLPLRALVGRSHVRLRIRCEQCGFSRVSLPETVIARLSATGAARSAAPGALNVSDVAERIKGPCRQCQKTAWRVDVLWPNPRSDRWRRAQGAREC